MKAGSSLWSRAYSGILFGFVITFVVNVSLRAQAPESPSAAVRKPRAQDLNPPSAPRGLIAEVANCHQVELRWIAPAEGTGARLKAYVVRRSDGGESTIIAGRTSFSDANRVSPSTGLTYTVSAVDAGGNLSAASNAVTVTTPPCAGDEQGVGDFEGNLEVSIEDYPDGKSRTLHVLQTNKERLPIQFAGEAPGHLSTGAPVHIKGRLLDGILVVNSGDTDLETLAMAVSSSTSTTTSTSITNNGQFAVNTFGEQTTLVMLVNFQNDAANRPWTFGQVQTTFGTVSNFYLGNSYQQTWLTTDVIGWYVLPLDNSTCDSVSSVATYANAAATSAGVNLSAYAHIVYVMPWVNCTWVGMANVSGSKVWINQKLTLGVAAHEIGHNLGLNHAHSWVCNNTGDGSGTMTGPYCFGLEYGDGLDTMGWSKDGPHFSPFAKEFLGWLNYGNSPPITTVQTNGTYTLAPYEMGGSTPKAIKILKSINPTTGFKTWYYVEYRQAIGFDSYLATINPGLMNSSNILNGVLVRTGSLDDNSNTSYLLDMTPATYQLYTQDPALDVGNTFSDPAAGVTITTQWVNGSSAGVSVTLSQPCVRANPAITVSPSSQSGQPGASVSYTVSVTNKDGNNCGPSTFSLQASLPAGWTGAYSVPALTISPAGSATATLTITSAIASAVSAYSVGVTATSTADTATALASYSVVPSLVTSVSTDQSTYAPGSTITITDVTKTSTGAPIANANVSVTVTKPNGAVVTQSATSDASGTVRVTLKLSKQKDPKGIYQVLATAASGSISAKASTTFTVQ